MLLFAVRPVLLISLMTLLPAHSPFSYVVVCSAASAPHFSNDIATCALPILVCCWFQRTPHSLLLLFAMRPVLLISLMTLLPAHSPFSYVVGSSAASAP